MEATAQSIANSTSPYVLQGSEFTNSTGTFWKDSRYWTFYPSNSTYAEKSFPYVGSEQPLAPLKWDSTTDSYIHNDTPQVNIQETVILNTTPNTPPPVQTTPYVAPNYQPQQVGEPTRWPVNIDTENYSIREQVQSDGSIDGFQTIFGTPHIIIDGVAQPYHVEETNDKVIFRSNSIGGLIFDKNQCAYSIYDNGWTSDPKIPSVSITARQADVNTDNWLPLDVNSLSCDVSVEQLEGKVIITSSKNVMGNVQIGGNTTTQIVRGVEHELIADVSNGIKETFRVTTDQPNKKLGVIQTVHVQDIMNIGGVDYNIAELNGTFMDRVAIEQAEAQIFEITENLNYDFDVGFDRLWGITFEDGGIFNDNKIMLDYSNNQEVAETYLEIDPTWTTSGTSPTTNIKHYVDTLNASNVGAECLTGVDSSSSTSHAGEIKIGGQDCNLMQYTFDTSSISLPVNAITTGASFMATASQYSSSGYATSSQRNCDITDVDTSKSAGLDMFTYIARDASTIYSSDQSWCKTSGSHIVSLSNTPDFSSTSTFDLGVRFVDHNTKDTSSANCTGQCIQSEFTSVSLGLSYTIPPNYLPPPPTNLQTGAIQSSAVNLSWNEPSGAITEEFGLGQELGYKIYKSDYPYASQNLPSNQAGDSITGFTGEVTASEMADNELLFHFDALEGIEGTTNLDVDDIIAYYELEGSVYRNT